jgi:hypothetical protein
MRRHASQISRRRPCNVGLVVHSEPPATRRSHELTRSSRFRDRDNTDGRPSAGGLQNGAGGATPTRWARRGGGPVRPSGWPPCARGVPRLDERQGCPLVLARSVGRPWTGARRPALRAPAVRAVPRMDCALHIRSRHSNLGGELRNPESPDDLGEGLLHGEPLVDGGQKESAGKRAVAQPLREIDVPVFTVSCRVCPPASHSNTGARRMS